MIKDMKIFMNGQEISLPKELTQMMNLVVHPQVRTPMNPFEHPMPQKVRCIDEQVRLVVMEMNKRLMEVEKLVKLVKKPRVTKGKMKVLKEKKKPKIKSSSKANLKGSSIKTSKIKINKINKSKKK